MADKHVKIVVDIEQGKNGRAVLSILESDLDKITRKATQSQRVLGDVFAGTFLGNIASNPLNAAINATFGLLTDAANAAKNLGIASIKLAGDFEVTANSLKVFTGSTRLAKQELSDIEKLAQNTTGLRLVAAQEGYQQLRALGFQAQLSRGFIKELGEEKILSGASDESLKRIIFNFAQIASGGQKVSQELREITTQMPTLKKAFEQAFGTTNPQKIQTFFDKDTEKAFQMLIDAMAKGEQAAGGLNDSVGKLEDSLISAGRSAGEPILEPLTRDIKDLTTLLNENRATFAGWGESVADILRGVRKAQEEYNNSEFFLTPFIREGRRNATADGDRDLFSDLGTAFGYVNPFSIISMPFEQMRRKGEQDRLNALRNAPKITSMADLSRREDATFSPEALKEREAREAIARRKAEQERARELAGIKATADEANTIYKNRFEIEQALRDSNIRYNSQQEIEFITASAKARNDYLQSEIARQTRFYNQQIALQDGNDEAIAKLESEKNRKLSDLNKQLRLNAINSFKQIQEQEKRNAEERRRATIESLGLLIQEHQFATDKQIFEIERGLQLQTVSTETGFNQLINVTKNSLAELLRLNKENYEQQLKDKSLSEEQKANITQKYLLEERRLVEENARKLIEIEDRKKGRISQIWQGIFSAASQSIGQREQRQSAFTQTIFDRDFISGRGLSTVADSILKQSEELKKASSEYTKASQAFQEAKKKANDAFLNKEDYTVQDELNKAATEAQDTMRKALTNFENVKTGLLEFKPEFERFRELISKNPRDTTIFDQIEKEAISASKSSALAALDAEILKVRKAMEDPTADQNTLINELTLLQERRGNVLADFYQREQEQQRRSIEGLTQYRDALKAADPTAILSARADTQKDLLREQIGLYRENIALQERIAHIGEDSAARYKNAWLSAIYEVRDANIRAVEEQIRANVRLDDASNIHSEQIRARVLSHLAEQKTASENIADSIINVYEKAGDSLDKLIDKSGIGKVPFFGDLAKGFARSKLTEITRGLLDQFIPGLSKEFEKTGNPMLDENIKQTKLLESIDRKVGIGGITGGGNFPAANYFQKLLGGGQASTNPISFLTSLFTGGGSSAGLSHEAVHAGIGGSGAGGLGSLASLGSNPMMALLALGQITYGTSFGRKYMQGVGGFLTGGRFSFGLVGFLAHLLFKSDPKKKYKKAVKSAYSVNIDDTTAKTLQSIGEGYFGRKEASKHIEETIRTPEAIEIIEAYAESTNQKSGVLQRAHYSDPNWSGNQFRGRFSGYGSGASSAASIAFSRSSGSVAVTATGGSTGVQNRQTQALLQTIGMLAENVARLEEKLTSMRPGDVVAIGAPHASVQIAQSTVKGFGEDSRLTERFQKQTGQR